MAASAFAQLLSPGRIGPLELRNRIIVTAMGVNLAEADGTCGERIRAFHEEQARGGVGLVNVGVAGVAWPAGGNEPGASPSRRTGSFQGSRRSRTRCTDTARVFHPTASWRLRRARGHEGRPPGLGAVLPRATETSRKCGCSKRSRSHPLRRSGMSSSGS